MRFAMPFRVLRVRSAARRRARTESDVAGVPTMSPECVRCRSSREAVHAHPGIAKRTAIDVYRREARRPARALNDVAADDPALVSLPPDIDALDAVWHVRRAIDTLSRDEATIVRLQHLDGLTHNEISEELGIALGTVKSRSHRAHRKLAALLDHLREVPS
jgi:predicted DNA-binding protein (UPF0251 family)